MNNTTYEKTLYYVIDPMCSWCWGFRPTWEAIAPKLFDKVEICYLMGGLAPDTDQPMPIELQEKLQGVWRKIQRTIPGTQFNFTYWNRCKPRRSTYPACRAVIAARNQGAGADAKMVFAIQQAYYLQARNPSDNSTLIELASELEFDVARFKSDINNDETQLTLLSEIQQRRYMCVQGFPSLVLKNGDKIKLLAIEFGDSDSIVKQVMNRD